MQGAPGRTLAVLIATSGRPRIVADLVRSLAQQSRPPDRIVCIGALGPDIAAIEPGPGITAVVGRRGSAHQRNDALALAGAGFDTMVFFDDDFVPSRFWLERAEALLARDEALVCLTGAVLADGNRSAGIAPETARATVAARDAAPAAESALDYSCSPYGCNMAFKGKAIAPMRFDERLPLYGWLEDKDFGERARAHGKYAKATALWGVHMGAKNGKGPGLRLGYSQVANAAYLAGKGTIGRGFALRLVAGNVAANLVRSARPEAWVDRRGRLRGNLLAIWHGLSGRLAPERILEF